MLLSKLHTFLRPLCQRVLSSSRLVVGELPATATHEIQKPICLLTANQKQILHNKIFQAITKYKRHDGDTGNPVVQIAVMTEKIINLARHFAMHRKDRHSKRGFEMLISRRKQMLIYLKKSNFEEFKQIVKDLDLMKEALNLPPSKFGRNML